jgi:cephalosporin-C deacetylase-like acetyl esterase
LKQDIDIDSIKSDYDFDDADIISEEDDEFFDMSTHDIEQAIEVIISFSNYNPFRMSSQGALMTSRSSRSSHLWSDASKV